ncbi:energy transducer TonB [Hymenobacter actinosclerus]|uniref:TonB protein C-terminal n=1 Tax=Hymenobacter actinosclerus TaxID=82805 RepID=A0A1I0I210_9BACT|nr:TonB family protein [Hymenobacter actinosclerus]SET90664.1 TonB protein C-terminal [Hymenobacter actinosclerus]
MRNQLLLLCLLLLNGFSAAAQVVAPFQVPTTAIKITELNSTSNTILDIQASGGMYHHWHKGCDEKSPVFKGGNDSLVIFLQRNAQWPDSLARFIKGKVRVQFIIDECGNVRTPRVVQSLNPLADAEALRLVRLLSGRFTPGSLDGRSWAVGIILPVTFSGSDAESGKPDK